MVTSNLIQTSMYVCIIIFLLQSLAIWRTVCQLSTRLNWPKEKAHRSCSHGSRANRPTERLLALTATESRETKFDARSVLVEFWSVEARWLTNGWSDLRALSFCLNLKKMATIICMSDWFEGKWTYPVVIYHFTTTFIFFIYFCRVLEILKQAIGKTFLLRDYQLYKTIPSLLGSILTQRNSIQAQWSYGFFIPYSKFIDLVVVTVISNIIRPELPQPACVATQ